jgi:hypothetical protein
MSSFPLKNKMTLLIVKKLAFFDNFIQVQNNQGGCLDVH